MAKQKQTAANKQTAAKVEKPYAALLLAALSGTFGPLIQAYYSRAVGYHAKAKTQFPRKRVESVELMNPVDAKEWIENRKLSSIPPGDHAGNRLFDQMMIEAKTGK
jgi:hypothetical protein